MSRGARLPCKAVAKSTIRTMLTYTFCFSYQKLAEAEYGSESAFEACVVNFSANTGRPRTQCRCVLSAHMYLWLFRQYRGHTQNVDHRHIIGHSWAWYAVGVGIRERRRKMVSESKGRDCSYAETGRNPFNLRKYNNIPRQLPTAMERFGDPKRIENGEVVFGSDIAVLKEVFDPLRKTEMKVGDVRHGRERRDTYHRQVGEIVSKIQEFIDVRADAERRTEGYVRRPLSLEGVYSYPLLLPASECKREAALEDKRWERRRESEGGYNSDECDGTLLVTSDATARRVRERSLVRDYARRDRSRPPSRGPSPEYSQPTASSRHRDPTPSRRHGERTSQHPERVPSRHRRRTPSRRRHRTRSRPNAKAKDYQRRDESPQPGSYPRGEDRGRSRTRTPYEDFKRRQRTPSQHDNKRGHSSASTPAQRGTPTSSPQMKMPKLKSYVSKPKPEEPLPDWDPRTPPYHKMVSQPERFIEWLASDLCPAHYEGEVYSLRHFGDKAARLTHRIIAMCAWAQLCHIHGWNYPIPFIPEELMNTAPYPDYAEMPEAPDLGMGDLRQLCRDLWAYLVYLIQFWEDAAFSKQYGDYGGPLRPDANLSLFVRNRVLFLFGGLQEITPSEIDSKTPWCRNGDLRYDGTAWQGLMDKTSEARKAAGALISNAREAYRIEARHEWDTLNLYLGAYGRFPCPRFDENLRPGDLQSTERYPQPKPQPQLTAQQMQKNLKDWELRKEAATTEVPLPPGVGGNPTKRQLDDEDDKIREQAIEYCRRAKKAKPRGKVSFKEPEPAAGAATDTPTVSTSVEGRDEDENGEQLDYYDDIGPAPYDPMDAEASEDVLRGPTMEVSSSQETELLDDLSGTAHGAVATEPDTTATGVTKQLSRLTPEGLDAVAAELNRLRASTPTSPECVSRQIVSNVFERVLGDLGPTVSKGSDNPR